LSSSSYILAHNSNEGHVINFIDRLLKTYEGDHELIPDQVIKEIKELYRFVEYDPTMAEYRTLVNQNKLRSHIEHKNLSIEKVLIDLKEKRLSVSDLPDEFFSYKEYCYYPLKIILDKYLNDPYFYTLIFDDSIGAKWFHDRDYDIYMYYAGKNGDKKLVKFLLDTMGEKERARVSLYWAAVKKSKKSLMLLLCCGVTSDRAIGSNYSIQTKNFLLPFYSPEAFLPEENPLFGLIRFNAEELFDIFISIKTPAEIKNLISYSNSDGITALDVAIILHRENFVYRLLALGADPLSCFCDAIYVAHWVREWHINNPEGVHNLVEEQIRKSTQESYLTILKSINIFKNFPHDLMNIIISYVISL
jgi:hypothetical protein